MGNVFDLDIMCFLDVSSCSYKGFLTTKKLIKMENLTESWFKSGH